MGEVSPEHIVVTAFLSEGCDSCVSQRSTIEKLGTTYSEYPIFISYDETLMDDFGVEYTPSVLVSNIITGESIIHDGEASYSDVEDMIHHFRHTASD